MITPINNENSQNVNYIKAANDFIKSCKQANITKTECILRLDWLEIQAPPGQEQEVLDLINEAYDPKTYELDDIGNSERFVNQYGHLFHYVSDRGVWQYYSGKHWQDDTKGYIKKCAKEVARGILSEAAIESDDKRREDLIKHAKASAGNMRLKGMLELSQPELAVTADELDKDHYSLNVDNGTINLITGELKPHDPVDLLTVLIPIDYDSTAKSDLFIQFLNDTFQGDPELIEYVQTCFGYGITGSQTEQALWLFYGPHGNNGKTTLTGAICDVMGDYAGEIDPAAFMLDKNRNTSGPNEAIASLLNKRLVFSTEIKDGMSFDVGLIKRMTGGEKIHIERKFEHGFDIKPTHKLFLSSNHEPRVSDTTNSFWRRLKKVPFNYCVPEDKKDKHLREKLAKEHGQAILTWLVAGCLRWQQAGINDPEVVKAAIREYRDTQDILHDYLLENCVIEASASITVKALYDDFKKWFDANDTGKVIGKKVLSDRLKEKNITSSPGTGNKQTYFGIRLKDDFEKMAEVRNGVEISNYSGVKVRNVPLFPESSQEKSRVFETLRKTPNISNVSNYSNTVENCQLCGGENIAISSWGHPFCMDCQTPEDVDRDE